MHKTDVIKRVARETRLSQRVVSDVVNATHRLIEGTLREGKTVTFPGFGTFYTSKRRGGKLKDFRSGKEVSYPARRVAGFRVGEILKRAVRGERRTGGLAGLLKRTVRRGPRKKAQV
jgi:DNA-binding protein HU-beta